MLVPDAGVLFDYNRFAYTRGNPLRYTDPSGHCGTLAQDGSVVEDDAECWQYALDIYLGWDGDAAYWEELFRMDRQQFWAIIAMDPHQRAPQLKAHVDKYWSAFYQRTGARHVRYNPAPTWDEPPPHPIEGIADAIMPYATLDCDRVDCFALAIDIAGVAGTSLVLASPACGPAVVACFTAGQVISFGTPLIGWTWTAYNATNGDATTSDVIVSTITAVGSYHPDPRISLLSGGVQLLWDWQAVPARGR